MTVGNELYGEQHGYLPSDAESDMSMADWNGAPRPRSVALDGRYARLEPLEPKHSKDLLRSALEAGAEERFRYLFDQPPIDEKEFAC